MFNFFKSKKNQQRQLFESFILERPQLNLEEALARYIQTYNLVVRFHIDEPKEITDVQTRLQILEETVFANPNCNWPELQTYLAALRVAVQGYDLSIQLQQEVKETKGEADAEPTARKRLVSEEQHQANLAVLRSIKIHKENNPEEAAPTPVKAEGQTGLFDSNPTKPEPVKPGARGDVKETASKTYLVSDEELAEVTERLKAKK